MKKIIASFTLVLIACFSMNTAHAQMKYTGFPSLVWPKLYDVKFVKSQDAYGEYDKPVFSAATKALNGKVVTLPGYMVPFEKGLKGSKFMFTALPLNACYFCGVGGPESVVYTKAPVSYHEKPVEISGILKLNDTDPDKMFYIIEQAEILGPVGF
jgi:hypothetical protein